MSFYIEVDDVTGVLLADGWHIVANNSFEFLGGRDNGVYSTGATWIDACMDGEQVYCPLTAVLAVRTKRE